MARRGISSIGASMGYRQPVSYQAFFRASLVALVLAEVVLVWRGADILVIVLVPLLAGLTIQVAIRLVPGWQEELDRLRDPDRRERQLRWRRPILLLTALVIGLSVFAALTRYAPGHH